MTHETADVPVGTVIMYAGMLNLRPLLEKGWLPCDGRSLPVAEYPDLFSALGNGHGGDGVNFRVPDLRGTFVRGVDGGAKRDPDANVRTAAAAGGNAGDLVGSVQDDAFRAHAHDAPHLPTTLHWAVDEVLKHQVAQWNGGEARTAETGGSETRPRNVALHYIIRFRAS